jgi:hypothetical protein
MSKPGAQLLNHPEMVVSYVMTVIFKRKFEQQTHML